MNDVFKAIQAINAAVVSHDLSPNSASPKWAGNYRYIGVERQDGRVLNKFEHIKTKRPLWVQVSK